MLRIILGLVGAGALVAMMHKTIMAGGGYDHGDADTIAWTAIVLACALCVVPVFRSGQWLAGLAVLTALIAGDIGRFGQTFSEEMERITKLQAPAAAAAKRRADAETRLAEAKASLGAIGSTTPRIEAAIRAKSATEQGVRDKTSKGGCRKGCTAQLAAQMASANAEVKAAYAALATRRQAVEARVSIARAALNSMKVPQSVSPAADLIGWSAALLNAALAGLKSIALNIGAIALLAIAGHGLSLSRETTTADAGENTSEQVARFALDQYEPDSAGQILLTNAYADYRQWCKSEGTRVIPVKDFVAEFDRLAKRAKLQTMRTNDNQVAVLGMAPRRLLQAA